MNSASQGFGMATALVDLARYLTFWQANDISPEDGHMFFWGSDVATCAGCTSLDADMHFLHDFTGDTSLTRVEGAATAAGSGALEVHDFAVGGADKRVIITFVPGQTAGALSGVTLDLGAWAGKTASVTAYRFAGQGAETLGVTPASASASASVTLQLQADLVPRAAVLLLVDAQ